ncbi:hypothetical protein Droror1_Dr00019849 [Drosera rotundifolia]
MWWWQWPGEVGGWVVVVVVGRWRTQSMVVDEGLCEEWEEVAERWRTAAARRRKAEASTARLFLDYPP